MLKACRASIAAILLVEEEQAVGLALRAHCTAAAWSGPAALSQTRLSAPLGSRIWYSSIR